MEERIAALIEKLNILIAAEHHGLAKRFYDPVFSNKLSLSELNDFEGQIGTELPEEFRSFLLNIGTRIGPDHGIYSRQAMIDTYKRWLEPTDKETKMSGPFALSNQDAAGLTELKKQIPHKSHFKPLPNVNGILPLTTEGCTYYSYLVLNGEQIGKVWLLNNADGFDTIPAGLTQEFSFFDWYENWLDEKLSEFPAQLIETVKISMAKSKESQGAKPFWKKWF